MVGFCDLRRVMFYVVCVPFGASSVAFFVCFPCRLFCVIGVNKGRRYLYDFRLYRIVCVRIQCIRVRLFVITESAVWLWKWVGKWVFCIEAEFGITINALRRAFGFLMIVSSVLFCWRARVDLWISYMVSLSLSSCVDVCELKMWSYIIYKICVSLLSVVLLFFFLFLRAHKNRIKIANTCFDFAWNGCV